METKTTLSNPHQPHSIGSHRQPSTGREDWWSEDATETLLQAWGHRFLRLGFGNLRQKDWKEVADAVNSSHCKGRPKTDAQCRSRIDTLKKKYKAEKAKLSPSSWRFFDHLDVLIGPVRKKPAGGVVKSESLKPYLSLRGAKYRESSLEYDEEEEDAGVEEGDMSEESACKELARAIVKLGEVYERIEGKKQRMMVELEKQRMEVVQELELQRINMLMEMEMQLELEKANNRKRGDGSGKK